MPPTQKQKQYKVYSTKFPSQLPLADIQYILGPDVFVEVLLPLGDGKEDRHLYFFGERHGIDFDNECFENPATTVTFPGFVNSLLLAHPDRLLDLYVELPYRRSDRIFWGDDNLTQDTVMNGFRAPPFRSCLTFRKKDCPFPNLRAHYIDYRSTHALHNHDLAIYLDMYRQVQDYTEIQQQKGLHKDYPWTGFLPCLLDFVRTNARLHKQYVSIPTPLKTLVFSFFEERLTSYVALATQLFAEKQNLELFQQVVRFNIPALLMDLYGFGRMLRDFVGAPSPHTLLVYTGFCHTEIYVTLLLKIGASIVSQNRPVPSCDPRIEKAPDMREWNHCLPASALGSLL